MPGRTKKRVGRPRSAEQARAGEYVGFRAPKELKDRLEHAAAAANRSLSTEAQVRLEHSFVREEHFGEALSVAYGEGVAALLLIIGDVINAGGRYAIAVRFSMPSLVAAIRRNGDIWLNEPYAFEQAKQAVLQVLDLARPDGEPVPPSRAAMPPDEQNLDPMKLGGRVANEIVDELLQPRSAPNPSSAHLQRIQEEAQAIIAKTLAGVMR